jgi:hypothetical protein
MHVTLIIVLSTWAATATGSSGTNAVTTYSTITMPAPKVVRIPMPDLKACLDARHQFDDYQTLIAAACSAE